MGKRIQTTLATAGVIVLAVVGGGIALALPAQASTLMVQAATGGVEDGTNDGETADDNGTDQGVEDGTNDGETADDNGTEVEDGTNDGETADDNGTDQGVEDGTNDGETNDDTSK